jgi:hypothetical protein
VPDPGCTNNCPGDPNPQEPNGRFSSTDAPVCTDGATVKLAANPHVVRHGTSAEVNFFLTDGDGAIVWYKEVGSDHWQFSVTKEQVAPFINSDHYASVPVNFLKPGVGYTFGVTQTKGCGGGEYVTAVVVDGPKSQTFAFSYWEWAY